MQRSPHVEDIDIEGEFLLYDEGRLRLLAGSAAQVWRRLDGMSSVGTIADTVTPVAVREDGRDDVIAFLGHLVGEGLVVLKVGPPAPSYRPAAHIGFVLDGETALLVDLESGRRQALNPTGSRIWELAWRGEGLEDIVDVLRAEYPDAPVQLTSMVEGVLAELHAAGYLERQ